MKKILTALFLLVAIASHGQPDSSWSIPGTNKIVKRSKVTRTPGFIFGSARSYWIYDTIEAPKVTVIRGSSVIDSLRERLDLLIDKVDHMYVWNQYYSEMFWKIYHKVDSLQRRVDGLEHSQSLLFGDSMRVDSMPEKCRLTLLVDSAMDAMSNSYPTISINRKAYFEGKLTVDSLKATSPPKKKPIIGKKPSKRRSDPRSAPLPPYAQVVGDIIVNCHSTINNHGSCLYDSLGRLIRTESGRCDSIETVYDHGKWVPYSQCCKPPYRHDTLHVDRFPPLKTKGGTK